MAGLSSLRFNIFNEFDEVMYIHFLVSNVIKNVGKF